MKITGVNNHASWKNSIKVEPKGGKSFDSSLDMANKEHSKQQLFKMIKKVKLLGNQLKHQYTEQTINDYKNMIRDYLDYVVKNYYLLKRDRSVDYSTLYSRIEIIDKEVEELTLEMIRDQQDIIAKIDKIEGLLLDIYQ